jgi:DNA polymerase-3 subunit gamma/tau
VQEPPPWVEDDLPDDDDGGLSVAARGQAETLPEPDDGTFEAPAAEPASKASPVAAARPAALPPLQPTVLGDQWAAAVRPLVAAGSVTALVRELALQAELLAATLLAGGGRCWQLRVERETLRNPALAAKLATALQDALGEPVQIEVLAGLPQDSIARRDASAREAAQRDAEQVIQNDPIVLGLMAQFRTARIVPGSIKPRFTSADSGEPKANPP